MTKQTGLGDRLLYAARNLSGDIGTLDRIGGGAAPVDVTGIDVSAPERLHGMFDGAIEFSSHWNPTGEDRAHETFGALPTGLQHLLYVRGSTSGAPAAGLVARQLNYDGSRDESGRMMFKVAAHAAAGTALEWGRLHTAAARSDTTATNGAGVDGAAASAQGLTAYLQLLTFVGTSVTVALQQSSDNGGGDAYAAVTGGAFAAANAPGTQRIQTASGLAVERWLRVVTTGTFTSAVFAVMVVRHELPMEF